MSSEDLPNAAVKRFTFDVIATPESWLAYVFHIAADSYGDRCQQFAKKVFRCANPYCIRCSKFALSDRANSDFALSSINEIPGMPIFSRKSSVVPLAASQSR